MSIIKLNNRWVIDVTAFGSISSLGSLTHIATQTASSSASLSFTSGINNTYKEYIFYFIDIHPASDSVHFTFNMSIDTGSNYNVTKTTTFFDAYVSESGSDATVAYSSNRDLAQSTNFQILAREIGNDNDQATSGFLHLFNPSSSVFVKHFISKLNSAYSGNYTMQHYVAGYGNTTSAVDAVQFKMSSGNIDSGQILLFGLS